MQELKTSPKKDFNLREQDEVELVIEKPKHGNHSKGSKHVIKDIQFIHDNPSIDSLAIYVSINKDYLQKLLSHRMTAVEPVDQRKFSTQKQSLVYKKDYKLRHFDYGFHIYQLKQDTVKFEVDIQSRLTDKVSAYSVWRLYYKMEGDWKSQYQKKLNRHYGTGGKAELEFIEFGDYLKYNDVFLEVSVTYKESDLYDNPLNLCGLVNVGNTCYMNSFLQTLYYIKSLRKTIVEKVYDETQQFGTNLQRVFMKLMSQNSRSADPTIITEVGPWSAGSGFQFVQKDIHEFKMSFFQQLQKLDPAILELFRGQVMSEVYCKSVEYNSKTKIEVDEVDVFLSLANRRVLKGIDESLRYLTSEELLDGRIDAEPYGMQVAYKKLSFLKLPKVLFFNLKRYEYNQYGLHKLLSKFSYEQDIDLSYLLNDGTRQNYTLYAVLIHRGKTTEQGHYYSYINVSPDVSTPNWYLFNDSIVQKVSVSDVFDSNFGGSDQKYTFNKFQNSFKKSYQTKTATAYILVYISKEHFGKIQDVEVKVPEKVIEKEKIRRTLERNKRMIPAHVLTVKHLHKQRCSVFDVENVKNLGSVVQIDPDMAILDVMDELRHSAQLDRKRGFTAWKIGGNRTVLNLEKQYKGAHLSTKLLLLGDQQQNQQDFYILLVPNSDTLSDREFLTLSHSNDLCLLIQYISWTNQQQFISSVQNILTLSKLQLTSTITRHLENAVYDNINIYQMFGKVMEVRHIDLFGRAVYCELVQSYMPISDRFYNFLGEGEGNMAMVDENTQSV